MLTAVPGLVDIKPGPGAGPLYACLFIHNITWLPVPCSSRFSSKFSNRFTS